MTHILAAMIGVFIGIVFAQFDTTFFTYWQWVILWALTTWCTYCVGKVWALAWKEKKNNYDV